ncbi:MAG: hypothetical protein IT385_05950 [Deltaproteobacteria bacterium]|nr:hypothetical protein [Deltaproteobacteria bacterium]
MPFARLALYVTVVAFGAAGCGTHRFDWASQEGGGSNSGGSNSDGSKSDNSGGDNSQSGQSKSSDGPSTQSGSANSDTHSESSGTVTTQGQGGDSGTGTALLVLVGLTLIGATIASAVYALDQEGAGAYLEKHGREVRLALARGEGTFVHDVAHNLGLAPTEVAHLGRVLRDARGRLEPLVGAGVEPGPEAPSMRERGRLFVAELTQVLLADPVLVAPTEGLVEGVRARHGELLKAP